ncbi:MAG: endonuclease MutS2 [Chloroflexi bacterium]|nr:endonuclease MutS2 [Chloroflexota bacterium]
MDNKSLEILEFPKIRDILAEHTSFSASRHLALTLTPSSRPEAISLLLRQSAEARRVLSVQPGLSLGEVTDIREIAHTAAKGVILDPESLTDIQKTLVSARHLRDNLRKLQEHIPSLWDVADGITELPNLENEISNCIGPRGEVLDSASTQLANLRYQAKALRQRLLNRLQTMIESPAGRRFVQEPIITEREGRYVILVKEEMRHEARGIIHDVSRSEATVFVEPWATVELGNELKEVLIEEKREVERILAELSAKVGTEEEAISKNVALVAELDLALAKARYADRVKAIEPLVSPIDRNAKGDGGSSAAALRLVEARHPLLRGRVVPLSIEIGRDFSTLIVTGPNTGGKTVVLKTIGLLTLMAHAGMPIPASEGSCVPLFDSVFADIGDEQSIEQTLSTFSWHMGNIVRIIRNSTERTLVLLDELGTSTDPGEGAALARAILLHLLSQGTMTVATTHFSDLKVFAHTTVGMQNASLDFDPVTLTPTYHLTLGVPGGSNAIAVASQLGLPPEIIATARDMVGKGSEEMDLLLGDLMDEKRRIAAQRREMDREKEEAEKLRESLETRLQELRDKEQEILQETRNRLARETAQLERQVREAASELRKTKSREKIEQARQALAALREQMATHTRQAASEEESVAEEEMVAGTLAPGDSVWLRDMRLWGTVLSLSEEIQQVDVQVGHTRLRLNLEDVGKGEPSEEAVASEVSVVQKGPGGRKRSLELDLRGKRADAIPTELDRYLNDAFLDNFSQVRIIHGFGTGTVRQIVRDLLASHPLVKSFRYGGKGEGGDGVTVVEL